MNTTLKELQDWVEPLKADGLVRPAELIEQLVREQSEQPQVPVGVTGVQRRLIGMIADKIEAGTLYEPGVYSRQQLARLVRKMLDTQPAQHDAHEFLLRGILASTLAFWHRLTAEEAQNLVDFVKTMSANPAQQQARVDCGECPNVTSGCEAGHCMKGGAA